MPCSCEISGLNGFGSSPPLSISFTTTGSGPAVAPPAEPSLATPVAVTATTATISLTPVPLATSYYTLCTNVASENQYQYDFNNSAVVTIAISALTPSTLVG